MKPNLPLFLEGCLYYIDIAFPHLKLAIEIDGRLHEEDEDLFESDRWRQNALVADGWRVLRFTWRMLNEHPEVVVAAIRQALLSKTDTGLRRRLDPASAVETGVRT